MHGLATLDRLDNYIRKIDKWIPAPVESADTAPIWTPNPDRDGRPNPQRLALESEADEIFYGGSAGGGKSALLLGCAVLNHTRSIIFRRTSPNLAGIIDESIKLLGSDNYNITAKRHTLGDDRILQFGYMQHEDDKKNWQGRPHDYYGFDELTEFTRTQYQFVIGWNRTTKPGQRCRIVCTGNPPIDNAGAWVIQEFAPWLDDSYHVSAENGQLLWYTYDDEGAIQWSETARPGWSSRTFIPAKLADNPHLAADGRYLARLNAMPEPIRSAFRDGNWKVLTKRGNPYQVIPLDWIRAAQRRHNEIDRPKRAPDCVGHDVSRGGKDKTTAIGRWGTYFDVLATAPGYAIENGGAAAMLVHRSLDGLNPGVINVDVIGYGASAYDSLETMGYNVSPINVSTGSSYTDKSGRLKCRNLRTELVWRLRGALDPEEGLNIAIPDDPELTADLCSYIYKPLAGGIVAVLSKEEIKREIGRSPDIGDALLLANYEDSIF